MRFPGTVTATAKLWIGWRPSGLLRSLSLAACAAAILAFTLGFFYGLPGRAQQELATPEVLATVVQQSGSLVVFSEFGETTDTIWAADAHGPQERIKLASIDHAAGYGIVPTLSPDGKRVAYTLLPSGVAQPDPAAAELWMLDLDGGATRRLADRVDLLASPVWAGGSDAVVVRRIQWRDDGSIASELLRVSLDGSANQVATAEAALFPIDFSPDGAAFYFAVASPSGTELARAPAQGGGARETLAHLSDGITRDWHLSPDGARLAYLAQGPSDIEVAFVLRVVDLQTGEVDAPLADDGPARFNPLWEENGVLTIGRLDGDGSPARLALEDGGAVLSELPLPAGGAAGFDVPLSWSPDGVYLAVRAFDGVSATQPGRSRVFVIAADGGRRLLSQQSDVVIVGWLEAAP